MHKLLIAHQGVQSQLKPVTIAITSENVFELVLEALHNNDVGYIDSVKDNESKSFEFQKIVKLVLRTNLALTGAIIGSLTDNIDLRIIIESQEGTKHSLSFFSSSGTQNRPVLTIQGANTEVVLRNIALTNLGAQDDFNSALYISDEASVIVDNVDFTNCGGLLRGAIGVYGSTVHFYNSSFTGCGTSGDGGAIQGDNAHITIARTTFDNSGATYGGAIFIENNSSLEMYDSLIENTVCTALGNAIYIAGGINGITTEAPLESSAYLYNTTITNCGLDSFNDNVTAGTVALADNATFTIDGSSQITFNKARYGQVIAHIRGKTAFNMLDGIVDENALTGFYNLNFGPDFDSDDFPVEQWSSEGNYGIIYFNGQNEEEGVGVFNWTGGTINDQHASVDPEESQRTIKLKTDLGEKSFKYLSEVRDYITTNKFSITFATLSGQSFSPSTDTSMSNLFYGCSYLQSINISGFITNNITDMSHLFGRCVRATSINVTGISTANVVRMNGMFAYCSSLQGVDLSDISTTSVISMQGMFEGCTSLLIPDLDNFTTYNLVSISEMFKNCSSVTALDMSTMDLINVTHTTDTFLGCSTVGTAYAYNTAAVTKLNQSSNKPFNVQFVLKNVNVAPIEVISNLNSIPESFENNAGLSQWVETNKANLETIKVTGVATGDNASGLARLFESAPILRSVDFSEFDTRFVNSFEAMFYKCHNLKTVLLIPNATQSALTFLNMFYECSSLTELDLSHINTSNVTSFQNMFFACAELTNVNVTNWNTEKVTTMGHMFRNCVNLERLDLSSFDTASAASGLGNMFSNTGINKASSDWSAFGKTVSDIDRLNGSYAKAAHITFVVKQP